MLGDPIGQNRRVLSKVQEISDIFIYLLIYIKSMVTISDYTVIIEQDEDGIYVAKVPDISGCYTQGKTVEEVIKRIKEAIQTCLEAEKVLYSPLKFIGIQRVEVSA